jgi:hypothetical protein
MSLEVQIVELSQRLAALQEESAQKDARIRKLVEERDFLKAASHRHAKRNGDRKWEEFFHSHEANAEQIAQQVAAAESRARAEAAARLTELEQSAKRAEALNDHWRRLARRIAASRGLAPYRNNDETRNTIENLLRERDELKAATRRAKHTKRQVYNELFLPHLKSLAEKHKERSQARTRQLIRAIAERNRQRSDFARRRIKELEVTLAFGGTIQTLVSAPDEYLRQAAAVNLCAWSCSA